MSHIAIFLPGVGTPMARDGFKEYKYVKKGKEIEKFNCDCCWVPDATFYKELGEIK